MCGTGRVLRTALAHTYWDVWDFCTFHPYLSTGGSQFGLTRALHPERYLRETFRTLQWGHGQRFQASCRLRTGEARKRARVNRGCGLDGSSRGHQKKHRGSAPRLYARSGSGGLGRSRERFREPVCLGGGQHGATCVSIVEMKIFALVVLERSAHIAQRIVFIRKKNRIAVCLAVPAPCYTVRPRREDFSHTLITALEVCGA